MYNTAEQESDIKTWLFNNQATIDDLTRELRARRDDLLENENVFQDEVWNDFYDAVFFCVSEEISRRLGISADIIEQVLTDYHDLVIGVEYSK